MFASSGDSDNGSDTYLDDHTIRSIGEFIPRNVIVGFERIQFPSSDADDPGALCYWICRGSNMVAVLRRDWSRREVDTGRYQLTSLHKVMRAFRESRAFGLRA